MSKIAVFGLNGFLGAPTLEALTSAPFAEKVAFPIKAVTRTPKESTDKVEYIHGDLSTDEGVAKLIEELKGIDVVIELLGPSPALAASIEKIVGAVKPKVFIPSQFGTDLEASEKTFPGFLALKTNHSAATRALGVKTIDIYTSLFAAPGAFLYTIVGHVGIDPEAKTVTYYGPEDTKFSFTNTGDIGKIVAAIATHPNPTSLPDVLRVESGKITYKDAVAKWEAANGATLTPTHVSVEETAKIAKETWAEGFKPEKFLLYLNLLIGLNDSLVFNNSDDEIINPGESLFKWSKY